MIKLLAFDLDGTALNSNKEMTARTGEAIARAISSGIIAIPCTGREIDRVPVDVLTIPGIKYLIVNNGSQVYSLPERKVIYSRTIERETALSTLEVCRGFETLVFGSVGTAGVVDCEGIIWQNESAKKIAPDFLEILCIPTVDLMDFLSKGEDILYKFDLIVFDSDEHRRIWDSLSVRSDVFLTSSAEHNIEIMPPGSCKGNALKHVCSVLGVALEHVMAVGDNYNDKEMLAEAGCSVAMGNSVPALLELADSVTASCDEDGLAIAIESMLLNQNP